MLAIFNLFHPGQGGKITVQDIATYTTSAFRVMFKLQPSLETEVCFLCTIVVVGGRPLLKQA